MKMIPFLGDSRVGMDMTEKHEEGMNAWLGPEEWRGCYEVDYFKLAQIGQFNSRASHNQNIQEESCKYHIDEEEKEEQYLKTKRNDMKKKTQIKAYIMMAIITFGAATVNEDLYDSSSPPTALVWASVFSAAAWPLYWSWQGAVFLKTTTFRISLEGENER